MAERIVVPAVLQSAWEQYQILTAGEENSRPFAPSLSEEAAFPSVPPISIVIPLYGGAEDISACLDSLALCSSLVREVIVVDNASPDDAASVVEERSADFPVSLTLLRNERNLGFASACNRGAEKATGDTLLFLNSDTIVARFGLLRLLQSLARSGTIGAAGACSNNVGHGQQIEPTYTSLDTLDLFAEDFAHRPEEDAERDMLVGFCLAVRKSVWQEVGGFDTRFGPGLFEDNDLCYRIRRAGYKLILSSQSFVHHHGSRSLQRRDAQPIPRPAVSASPMVEASSASSAGSEDAFSLSAPALLQHNARLFQEKWREDTETGFASHLSGLSPDRIVFTPDKHPDLRRKKTSELARRADISLCLIVKNEERVLDACLSSAKPFFAEMIVVDTGSTDRTREIALSHGAKVVDYLWTESFADARNQSLKPAKGKWIFWLDADDTLPWSSGEAILQAALSAPEHIAGFVVPVQFVEDGSAASGTRVDHVKLFRNFPGLTWEGRIHEQILPSLREKSRGGGIARCSAVVLHSGYDTSPEGQARKRVRDTRLLSLDLEERPDHPFVLFNLGMTAHYTAEHEAAVKWLKRCLSVSPSEESHVRKAYALLALSQQALGQQEASLATLEEGLKYAAGDAELHFHLAHLFTDLKRYKEAEEHYGSVLASTPEEHFTSLDIGILGFKTFHNLGSLAWMQDDYRKAKEWWNKALEAAPGFLAAAFSLFDAALERGDDVAAQKMLAHVQSQEGMSSNVVEMHLKYARSLSDNKEDGGSDALLARLVNQHPQAIAPRLALARHLLHTGREGDAAPHLRHLSQQGEAEATYYLGLLAFRHNDFPNAQHWMQRAYGLNPDHEDTRKHLTALRQILAPRTQAIPMEDALCKIATAFGINAGELQAYAEEDTLGGYEEGSGKWPGGSVWSVEGQTLYALVRALKPETLVEVGSLVGCSASHLALACLRNGKGTVYAIDPYLDFSRVDPELLPFLQQVKADVFGWRPPEKIDFLFEDGAHTPGFTGSVLQYLKPHLTEGAAVLCHDYFQSTHGEHIMPEFRAELGKRADGVLIAPSNCGLGYARFATTEEGEPPEPEGVVRLRAAHPYPEQKPAVAPHDHGWLAEDTASALARHLSAKTRLVVELGAWLGRSARFITQCAPNATVIAVDHWQGSKEQQEHPEWKQMLPTLYETFLVNCWEEREQIIPLRMTTLEALHLLAHENIAPDLIYIDAAHDFESVIEDIRTARQLFPKALLVGDDWAAEGVQRAVETAAKEEGLEPLLGFNQTAWWLKPKSNHS